MRKFDPLAVDVPRLLSSLGVEAEHVGDRWIAKCPSPDHDDKSPSWDIKDVPGEPKHGLHKCLSCGFRGTATQLVMDLLSLVLVESAREWIAENAMGEPPVTRSVTVRTEEAGRVFRLPPEVVVVPVEQWPETPRRYVLGRRITPAQVSRWGLGYAIAGRLAGRVVVPARDRRGRLQHYTARTFAGHAKRYLEPKRTEGPHEGAVFGEQFWPVEGRELVVVTEGAFNAMAVERVAGVCVASLFGSTVKIEHLQKLRRFRRALVLTDPDLAGERAAEKIMLALRRHVEMRRVELPRGQDADSVEPDALRAALVLAWRKF